MNTKLLYSKYYRDRVFIFDLDKGYDKENVVGADVSVEDRLVVNFKFNLKMWPPNSLSFFGDSVISDVEVAGRFFIQLISTKQQAWICIYSYSLKFEEFIKKKCTKLASYIQLRPDSKIHVVETLAFSEEAQEISAPFVVVKVMNTLTNSYNNIFLNPESSALQTASFLVKPIGSINDFFSFKYFRFNKDRVNISFGDYLLSLQESYFNIGLIQIYKHRAPMVFFDKKKLEVLSHKNILTFKKRLDDQVNFRFINSEDRETMFDLDGVDDKGAKVIKIQSNIESLKNVVSKNIWIRQNLPPLQFERSPMFNYIFDPTKKTYQVYFYDAYTRYKEKLLSSSSSSLIQGLSGLQGKVLRRL